MCLRSLTGGWREQGIDPGIFANSLMEQVKAQDEKTDGQAPNPVVLMNNAYFQTLQEVEFGSSTCCIATLRPDGTLEVWGTLFHIAVCLSCISSAVEERAWSGKTCRLNTGAHGTLLGHVLTNCMRRFLVTTTEQGNNRPP